MELGNNQLTPEADSLYAFLDKPVGFPKGDFTLGVPHTEGDFSINQLYDLDNPEHVEFLKEIEDLETQAFAKASADPKNKGKKINMISKAKEHKDGRIKLVFDLKAADKEGAPRTIRVFDSGTPPQRLDVIPRIGDGSRVVVSFIPVQTQYQGKIHLKLCLTGVQIVKLEEVTSTGGFSGQTGGFVGAKKAASAVDSMGMAAQIEAASDNDAY